MSSSSIRVRFAVSVTSVVVWVLPAMGQRTLHPVERTDQRTAIPVPERGQPGGHPQVGAGGHYRGPGYYAGSGYYAYNSRGTQERALGIGRRTERYKQNAFEAERRLNEYRYRRGLPIPHPYAYSHPDEGFGRVYGSAWDSFYTYGRELEHYRQREFWAREELTYYTQHDYLLRGLSEFRAGNYGAAARSFQAAADLDHGDSGSRIHAAQALVATGVYDEAAKFFRRAFELRIRLLNVPFNLQADYGRKADYVEHVKRLESFCRSHPEDGQAWFVLAIQRFFGPEPSTSSEAMRKVKQLFPKDALAERLLQAAKPVLRNHSQSKNESSVKISRLGT